MSKILLPKRLPSGRLERSFNFGGLFLKLGVNLAKSAITDLGRGQLPSYNSMVFNKTNFEDLTNSLAQMRGAAMKLGQLLSIDQTQILSPELSQVFTRLQSRGYAMPDRQLFIVLNKNWGTDWIEKFKFFDTRPFAAASIGQVHSAVLKNGIKVAVKVQFPVIQKSIKSDISNLRLIAKATGLIPKNLDLEYYLSICEEQLNFETDYLREAGYLKTFAEHSYQTPHIVVPRLLEEFSTAKVLTMSYEEGEDFDSSTVFSKKDRNHIAHLLLDWTKKEIFEFRLVQTDPNFANFRYDRTSRKLKLLDFGASTKISKKIVSKYKILLFHIMNNDAASIYQMLEQDKLIAEKLPVNLKSLIKNVITVALSELHSKQNFSFADSEVFKLIDMNSLQTITQAVPTELIPAEILFVQRKLIGLVFLLKKLEVSIPLKQKLENYYSTLKLQTSSQK